MEGSRIRECLAFVTLCGYEHVCMTEQKAVAAQLEHRIIRVECYLAFHQLSYLFPNHTNPFTVLFLFCN